MTEAYIKNLNEVILVKPFWKDAITNEGQKTKRLINIGNYKEFPNSVRLSNGEIFEYASVSETPILMGDLIKWYQEEEHKNELHPIAITNLTGFFSRTKKLKFCPTHKPTLRKTKRAIFSHRTNQTILIHLYKIFIP